MELTANTADATAGNSGGDAAVHHETRDEAGEVMQFTTFTVGKEEYAVDIMAVREIKGWTDVTPLPNQPEYVRGVLNLRGIIVPIFDLRCRFGGGITTATPTHVAVIVTVGERIMGILVDAVSDILSVSSDDIRSVPAIDQRMDTDFLTGLVTVEERMVAILALDRLLRSDEPFNSETIEAVA